ncbi:hypothetical protein ABEB36_001828 [Hypothenemus hampei]|uniref:Secreted protein n=1 Tax=Hypothenemus hampei TaxID=57062 RepID=A0ABD1FGI0_HYPHA
MQFCRIRSCTLFAIAINEICKTIVAEVEKYICFDDVTIFCSVETVGEVTQSVIMFIELSLSCNIGCLLSTDHIIKK